MRIVLIIFFIAIIASLGSALYYMVGQRHTSGAPDKRMARALAIRVGLSVTAFVLLMAGLILYETSQIIHGGETNYIMATVTLYVSIYNLFTSLLHVLGIGSSNE